MASSQSFQTGSKSVAADELGDLGGGAVVVDGELRGGGWQAGALVGGEFDAAALDGEVEVVGAGAGVAAGFGVAIRRTCG